jgi:hypothetical protein
MKFVFWNCAHGLMAKHDLILHYISKFTPEIFFVSEAELRINKNYSCLTVPGYDLEVSKTLGAGFSRQAAYVRTGSSFKRKADLENGESEVMVFSNNTLKVCGVYKPFKPPPSRSTGEAFNLLMNNLGSITSSGSDVIIAGDFNVNWNSEGLQKRRLESWAEESGLFQAVNQMTRHQEVTTTDGIIVRESCLDLLFLLTPKKVMVEPAIGSDHDLIIAQLDTTICKPKTKKMVSIDWRNYNALQVSSDLNSILCTDGLLHAQDVLDSINSSIIQTLNKWAPKRVVRLRGEQEFENCRIEAMKKRRDRAFKKFKKTGNLELYLKAKSLTKTLRRIIKSERKRVFRAKMKSHGVKSLWRTVGAVFNDKSQKEDMRLKIDGVPTRDKSLIAEEFSKFFIVYADDAYVVCSSDEV